MFFQWLQWTQHWLFLSPGSFFFAITHEQNTPTKPCSINGFWVHGSDANGLTFFITPPFCQDIHPQSFNSSPLKNGCLEDYFLSYGVFVTFQGLWLWNFGGAPSPSKMSWSKHRGVAPFQGSLLFWQDLRSDTPQSFRKKNLDPFPKLTS